MGDSIVNRGVCDDVKRTSQKGKLEDEERKRLRKTKTICCVIEKNKNNIIAKSDSKDQ